MPGLTLEIRTEGASLRNVQGAWVKEHRGLVENDNISGYQVNMLVTFVLE